MSKATPSPERNNSWNISPKKLWYGTGLRGKLLLSLLPTILIIILVVGAAFYKVSKDYIRIALGRTVAMQNLAMVHDIEIFMENCATDLRFFAQCRLEGEDLGQQFRNRIIVGGIQYYELAFIPASTGKPQIFINKNRKVTTLADEDVDRITPNPLLELERLSSLKKNEVQPSYIRDITYPHPDSKNKNMLDKEKVIRFYIKSIDRQGKTEGIMLLSIRAEKLRNFLTLYDSKNSPLWSFTRSDELRFSYFVDPQGWILFQSIPKGDGSTELTSFLARQGYRGTLGKAEHNIAFRPSELHADYWERISKIQKKEKGLEFLFHESDQHSSTIPTLAYAPICFKKTPDGEPEVYGGIIYTDRSVLPKVAGYDFMNILLVVSGIAIAATILVVLFFGRALTNPIREFAAAMAGQTSLDELKEVDLPYKDHDLQVLQKAFNRIIKHVNSQYIQIKAKDEELVAINSQERADLREETQSLADLEITVIPEIIGYGKQIESLKNEILKAGGVDVDVLIYGETGTGKQLVAEAVHNNSARREMPFISINCGALDESLLLDTLFGHVKGAFSDAKTDRKGAFIEAHGGTLFLDEIQSASLKVQQSLLRAIASRRLKPLGSDKETAFDIRIIVATNADLPGLIKEKQFREDLYYRLKVLMIQTPALRDHPESIPLLSLFYIKQAEKLTDKKNMALSRGAVAKLVSYQWPGNVRELVNSITRSVVMAESNVIQAREIRLEGEDVIGAENEQPLTPGTKQEQAHTDFHENTVYDNSGPDHTHGSSLNERQLKAWKAIQSMNSVTRNEYQKIVGGRLPSRTAIYDLQILVKSGKLRKTGRGPSTRYIVEE
ncbi:sigma 54-interacting transcriptional regulator [Maridesulfovibrio sp.]|uniref:sigma 54-interacting transcriptional regulator n=1 Tax=Maridesulfovibrio sp. TaxID=2795000 RepID=UPI0029F46918|nr:sigma 54-interacting transcriptional regulator [Maridesulfovibrio sp.]